jgi:serine protease Do
MMVKPGLHYRLGLLVVLLLLSLYWSFNPAPTVAQHPPILPSVEAPEGVLAEVYEAARGATVRIEGRESRFARRAQGIGTGFFISEDGLVLTAYHVTQGANFLSAVTADERRYPLDMVGFDAALDLALLRARARETLPFLRLADEAPSVGDVIVAIGNSRGDFLAPRSGVVTRLMVDPSLALFAPGTTELTAALAPGDSGGPVLNEDGVVVGVVSYISFRPEQNHAQDMPAAPLPPGGARDFASYAVPVLRSSPILADLMAGVQRDVPAVGFVAGEDYAPGRFGDNPLGPHAGATVQNVSPGSPGDLAGLLEPRREPVFNNFGKQIDERLVIDVIIAVDGERTRNFAEAVAAIRRKRVGDEITLTVQRGEEIVELTLTLAPRASVQPR